MGKSIGGFFVDRCGFGFVEQCYVAGLRQSAWYPCRVRDIYHDVAFSGRRNCRNISGPEKTLGDIDDHCNWQSNRSLFCPDRDCHSIGIVGLLLKFDLA